MIDLNAAQLEYLIEIAGRKTFFDYLSLFLQTLVPLGALAFGYSTLKAHALRIAAEKLIEKDIDRLYQSVDYFFEYADKVNLFFSLQLTVLKKRQCGDEVPQSLKDKLAKTSDMVYENIANIRKASFILTSLGKTALAQKIDCFREETIKLRKTIFNSLEGLGPEPSSTRLKKFIDTLDTEKDRVSKLRDECLSEVAAINNEKKKRP